MTSSAPQGQSFTSRIAMWSARHRKAVAIAWVLAVIAALAACSGIGADTDISDAPPGEAGEAADVFEESIHHLSILSLGPSSNHLPVGPNGRAGVAISVE